MRNQLLFFLLILFQLSYSQNSSFDFGVFIEDQELNNVRCLDNEADYSTLEIRDLLGNESQISNVSIIANLDDKASQSFDSFDAFKNFNFKFWLLSNNAYKTVQSLNIIINATDNSNTTTIEQIAICLRYIDAETVDRGEQKPDFVKMPVYFATDRNYVKTDDVYKTFGTKRSSLKYGICEVSIPHDHKIGEIESPSIWRFEFTEDPNKHIVLQ